MRLAIITAHAQADSLQEATNSWVGEPLFWNPVNADVLAIRKETCPPVFIINGNSGMLQAYEFGYRHVPDASILAFFHDDLLVHDQDWVSRVLKEFEDPKVGLVGFGGALGHGSPELYKVPYDYHQLGRSDFLSNMTDAENHGKRFTGACDVAVLDGFSLIVRRELLSRAGGWLATGCNISYIGYDYWLCCMVRRLGFRIRLVGVSSTHFGGRTFVRLGIGKDPKHWQQYLDAHRYIYDEFKDVLPYRVPQ